MARLTPPDVPLASPGPWRRRQCSGSTGATTLGEPPGVRAAVDCPCGLSAAQPCRASAHRGGRPAGHLGGAGGGQHPAPPRPLNYRVEVHPCGRASNTLVVPRDSYCLCSPQPACGFHPSGFRGPGRSRGLLGRRASWSTVGCSGAPVVEGSIAFLNFVTDTQLTGSSTSGLTTNGQGRAWLRLGMFCGSRLPQATEASSMCAMTRGRRVARTSKPREGSTRLRPSACGGCRSSALGLGSGASCWSGCTSARITAATTGLRRATSRAVISPARPTIRGRPTRSTNG